MSLLEEVYYGECKCTSTLKNGKNCSNNAYYISSLKNGVFCGVHCKDDQRTKLKVNPNKDKHLQDKFNQHLEVCNKVSEENKINGVRGIVMVSKLFMMKQPLTIEGFLNVFPNFKHQNRKDGFGCASLSPMSLGPIMHVMPNMPPAKNLENFYQFSKVYPHEIDKHGNLSQEAKKLMIKGYTDNVPHRHKFLKLDRPLYSVFYDSNGIPKKYTYLESRYFYCYWYSKLVSCQPDFYTLVDKVASGMNINIVGYDGYNVVENLYNHYIDTSRPFGHELVLFTLLSPIDEYDFPWNKYYRLHKKIYDMMFD